MKDYIYENLTEEIVQDDTHPEFSSYILKGGNDYVSFTLKKYGNTYKVLNFENGKIDNTLYTMYCREYPLEYKKVGRGRDTLHCLNKIYELHYIAIYKMHSEKGFMLNVRPTSQFMLKQRPEFY